VGGLPIAYSLSAGSLAGLPLDERQVEEVLLTAALATFAVGSLINFRFSAVEAGILLVAFMVQFVIPVPEIRLYMAFIYLALTVVSVLRQRRELGALFALARSSPDAVRAPQAGG